MSTETVAYHVSCSACDFEATIETVDDILDRQAEHRREHSDDHVLEFEVDR